MNGQGQSAGRWKSGAGGAALTVLLGLLFLPHRTGQGLADLSFDLPFRFRTKLPTEKAIIIYMDEQSAKEKGQMWTNGTWDRALHAQLLQRLKNWGAKGVVFDLLFVHSTTSDDAFISTINEARQAGLAVVIGGEANVSKTQGGSLMIDVIAPIAALTNVADWGLAELGIGSEPLRRHFPGTERVPSLAWRAAQLTLPPLGDVPAERWINYYGPPGFLSQCRYAAALEPRLTGSNVFKDKVCFVGAWPGTTFAGGTRADEWSTPYSRWGGGKSPGVEVTATVYLNLAGHDFLTRLSGLAELFIIVLAGIIFGCGLALCRPAWAVVLGMIGTLAVAAIACGAVWHWHVWFSWLIVAGVQIPVAVTWSALAYTKRLTGEKTLLEERLATVAHARQSASPRGLATIGGGRDTEARTVLATDPRSARDDRTPVVPDHMMLRRVGKGAYGEVWLARNAIGAYHAVKIVRRANFGDAEPFEREFGGLQRFMPISRSHPGLVQILHVGRRDEEGFIYYIMEAADDEDTGQKIDPQTYAPKNLANHIRKHGHLPAAECLQLGLDLTSALEFLHQQKLIHRDIKPANIIFVKGAPKFADIGLVTDMASTGGQVTFLGTAGYLAPEGPGTPAADVFSLGKVLYEASMGLACEKFPELSGTLLQRSDHAETLQLNGVLLKACRQDVSQRYQTAAEMHQDLLRVAN